MSDVRVYREIPPGQPGLHYSAEQRRMLDMRGVSGFAQAKENGGQAKPSTPDAQEPIAMDPSGNYPIKVPWLMSKGNRPFLIKIERPFMQVMNLPVKEFTVPQDFVLVAISCRYSLQALGDASFRLPGTFEVNVLFNNRTFLFTSDVPFQAIPERQHALLLPCPYYLPAGTVVDVTGLDQAAWSFNQSAPQAPLSNIWFGFFGYYVSEQLGKGEIYNLSRPLFYVQRFDLESDSDTAQQVPLNTIRDADLFEVNRLLSCALLETTGAGALVFSPNYNDNATNAPIVHHGSVQAKISNQFLYTNEINPWQVSFGTPEFPMYMSPPWRICPGSPIVVSYSDTWTRPEVQYSYYIFGGKNIYDAK